MSVKQQDPKGSLVENEKWQCLASCIVIHVKKALVGILHNNINHQSITPLPSDPSDLYHKMLNSKNKLKNLLKQNDLLLLLPNNKKVFSDKLDITMLRFLIRTFCNILNEDRNWNKPRDDDHSIAAAVFRAASIRNEVLHHGDPESIQDDEFETTWSRIENILTGLQYKENISDMKNAAVDPSRVKHLHSDMTEDFEKILVAFKEKCKNEGNGELKTFVKRRFKDKNSENIITDFDTLMSNHDLVMVSGEAGLGKTFSAKNLIYLWASDKILQAKKLLYINSKRVNKGICKPSNASLISVTDLEDMLNDNTDKYLALFECFKKPIKDLVIIIDGVDELPIKENLDTNFLKKLEIKIENNEKISALDTVIGIYFGKFLPHSKIIAFGRKKEIERLEEIQNQLQKSTLSNKKSQIVLELQALEEKDVKEFISLVNCGIASCNCEKCTETYNLVQNVEFRNIPSHLMALINIHENLPNPNFGRITKTKILIITIFNLLNNHTQTTILKDVKAFKKLLTFDKAKEFRECIQNIAKISFFSLLDKNVTIQVEAYNENDVDYFKYEQTVYGRNICVQIKRDILEQLDFFYIRDLEYHVILEPHHLTTMEFLASCYIHCHPDEWNLLLKPYFNDGRQTIILPYVAGLYSSENFTKDFVSEVLQNNLNDDVETYLSWLFSVEDVRDFLPWSSWYALKENGQLFPSFDLLHRVSEEVDVFDNISKKLKEVQTLVCYCSYNFEWYDMDIFQHKFSTNYVNKYNIKSFISKFEKYQIIFKQNISITTNEQFNKLLEIFDNDKIKFRICYLSFNYNTQHSTYITKHLKCNVLEIGEDCNSSTIDFLLNASSLSTPTTSSNPTIKCKQIRIDNIAHFNDQQTEKLFSIGLSDVVDHIALRYTFFTDGQLAILEKVERDANKQINIDLWDVEFNDMFDLPNFGNRHVNLSKIDNVTDNDVIEFKAHISPGYSNNLTKYKIIHPFVPFVRKENYSQDVEQSMFLSLCEVDFRDVSSDVFANTFSIIPSISCRDDDGYIPSDHWLRLSQIDDYRLNEIRIWEPRPENYEHFFKFKTNFLQLICGYKSELKQLLTHIVSDENIELDKEIKVFVVKFDLDDWNYYKEVTLFSGKTIKKYKKKYSSYDLLLDNFYITFHEGDLNTWWCCEIYIDNCKRN